MKTINGVYIIDFNIFLPTGTADAARKLALRVAAETGETNLLAF